MIKINGKEYRNIQEQVAKNQEDIEELKNTPAVDAYTKAEADAKFETKEEAFSGDYDDLTNKPTILEYESGDGILITSSGDNLRQISISTDVATWEDTYNKTEVDNKDTATLSAAKAYTDAQVIAGASVYEYVLTFDDTDTDTTWILKFISTNGTLVNTSVPENYLELVDFIKSYGMQRLLPGSVTTYNMDGIAQELNGNPKVAYVWVSNENSTDTLYARADGTLTSLIITASNLDTNNIDLVKRQC